MNNVDRQYLEMLRYVLENGVEKDDRTGTGTISVFGYQMRFNLAEGFPLLTTKKVYWNGIVEELLWFLRGDTNVKSLQDKNVHIWDQWADKNGDLGPVYGWNWRRWGAKPLSVPQKKPQLSAGIKATYLGIANGAGKEGHMLKKTWEGMIARCYSEGDIGYQDYGARGVVVSDRWLDFKAFAEDAEKIPNWALKKLEPRKYVLDKDGIGDGFTYSINSCQWITQKENANLKNNRIITVKQISNGQEFSFTNVSEFCWQRGFSEKNFSDLWTGRKKAKNRNGFTFVSIEKINPGIDQIADVIEQIKINPDSRRLIVSAWNVGDLHKMALVPCHFSFQFYVVNKKLSCRFLMRSTDALLGLPFNIGLFAILTMMIAQVCDLEPGDLVFQAGDLHIYRNHLEQVREQLTRAPYELPQVVLDKSIRHIDDFRSEHIRLVNYTSHPAIKAQVAV